MYFVFCVLLSTEFTWKFRVRDCLGESHVKDVSLKDECKMQLKIFTLIGILSLSSMQISIIDFHLQCTAFGL